MSDLRTFEQDGQLEIRDEFKREIGMLIVPWDTVVDTNIGPEAFAPGAFSEVNPSKVRLRMDHADPPTGKGVGLEERDDGAHMVFRVAKTQRGNDQLVLAQDGIAAGASVGFYEVPGGSKYEERDGRRVRVHHKVDLREVSTTWQPAYERAAVLYVRSEQEDAPVATEDKAPEAGAAVAEKPEETPAIQTRSVDEQELIRQFATAFEKPVEKIVDRLEKLEERSRMSFDIPSAPQDKPEVSPGQWMETSLKILSGERIPDAQYRQVADFITTDNAGIVPDAYSDRLIGVIDPRRPFMASTERLPVPSSGMSLVVPIITQRPTVGEQTSEKSELSSQKSIISTESFDMATYGGVGDISLQLLKRADRSFLELYLRLLAEAYAIETEDAAVGSLITAINDGGPEPATALDPEDLNLGAAFTASFDAVRRPPDTIWLSTGALAAFIDAKSDGTNSPLYPGAAAAVTAANGASGTISGLRPVHVPALDDKGAYAIVGPSSGFAWAEDGTFTLQVDVPSKAGRDVALVGMVWNVPWYPTAFTLFNVAS